MEKVSKELYSPRIWNAEWFVLQLENIKVMEKDLFSPNEDSARKEHVYCLFS